MMKKKNQASNYAYAMGPRAVTKKEISVQVHKMIYN